MSDALKLSTTPWIDECTGKPTRKTYWQLTCNMCGGFVSAGIARPKAKLAPQRSEDAIAHRYLCDTTGDDTDE